jgi:hypothetical protein
MEQLLLSIAEETNLAELASNGELTVEEVNVATMEQLEEDKYLDCSVLYWASAKCSIKVVEAALEKK